MDFPLFPQYCEDSLPWVNTVQIKSNFAKFEIERKICTDLHNSCKWIR